MLKNFNIEIKFLRTDEGDLLVSAYSNGWVSTKRIIVSDDSYESGEGLNQAIIKTKLCILDLFARFEDNLKNDKPLQSPSI